MKITGSILIGFRRPLESTFYVNQKETEKLKTFKPDFIRGLRPSVYTEWEWTSVTT